MRTFKKATSHRGVLFRPNAKGTTHRNGTRGDWWVSYVCALVQRVPGFSVCFSDGEAAADVVARRLEDCL